MAGQGSSDSEKGKALGFFHLLMYEFENPIRSIPSPTKVWKKEGEA